MVNFKRKSQDEVSKESCILNSEKQIPVFTLTIEQLEPLIKSWIRDCLDFGPVSQTSDFPTYLTREEVSSRLHISLPTLNTYTKLGLIPAKRMGTRVLYLESDVQNALKDIPVRLSRR
jgi:excisionase family DNA binding protein